MTFYIDGPVAEQVDVADDESVFKIDVECLSDEALDSHHEQSPQLVCVLGGFRLLRSAGVKSFGQSIKSLAYTKSHLMHR